MKSICYKLRNCSNCYSGEIAERVPVNIAGADDQGGGDGAQRGATLHRCRLTAPDHFLGTRHAAHRHDQSTVHGSGYRKPPFLHVSRLPATLSFSSISHAALRAFKSSLYSVSSVSHAVNRGITQRSSLLLKDVEAFA
ncbi:hypothetical protein K0M31_019440 [Melipona bicolor]|uniref:Uncharacterized protein n=1 Tax=Melipona bicolor TaxID=60889 RepID=A0AA40G3B0_9HYME|nr:hypothetical protein K0M31_019440 [Melipona bicolor]